MPKFSCIFIIILLGCTSKHIEPPVLPMKLEDVEISVAEFLEKSFEFEMKFHSETGLEGNFKGKREGDRVRITGVWKFAEAREEIDAVGIGDKEYRYEEGKWIEKERPSETRPAFLLQTVLSLGGYRFKSVEDNFLIYEFDANLLFMSPKLLEASGELWINSQNKIPEKIIARSNGYYWEFRAWNTGKEFKITSPLAQQRKLKLRTSGDLDTLAKLLKARFEIYGFSSVHCDLKENEITLGFMSETLPQTEIQCLLEPGNLELYTAVYPKQPVYELVAAKRNTVKLCFVYGDSTKPVILKEKLSQQLIATDFAIGALSKPVIELIFNEDLPTETMVAVIIDGEVIELFPKVWGKKLEISGNKKTWIKIKFPLTAPIKVVKD